MCTAPRCLRLSWLAIVAATAIGPRPRPAAGQVPRAWVTANTGIGFPSTGGMITATYATGVVRIGDSTGLAVTYLGSAVPNRSAETVASLPETERGVFASILFVRCGSLAFCDRISGTTSIGIGAFKNTNGPSTGTTRPGIVWGLDLPYLRTRYLDFVLDLNMLGTPEPHGRADLTTSAGLGARIF